jgi:hypothetical protein
VTDEFFHGSLSGSGGKDGCDGKSSTPLSPANESNTFIRGSFDGDLPWLQGQCCGDVGDHLSRIPENFGLLQYNGGIKIDDAKVVFREQASHIPKQEKTGNVLVLCARIGEVCADITQRRGAQKRITQCMQQDVRV